MDPVEARSRFETARVARLATVSDDGRPHLVPVTFAVVDDVIAIAVDHKPKSTVRLRRLANIAANPQVSLLVDEYDDDWDRLWWVRADGRAQVREEGPERARALERLIARYGQYREVPPTGAVILVHITGWTGWSFG
ncbi:TIGR03668 family PPOX class F420-dependent oxidoreductase [Streptosporangium sp. NPDC000239]|uniref:TIGR03668 family PPOX class F420-dependent oxidoreductase n=1 Tax=unclassified Streptosporangium TaxID=2632669 RepID=UPI00332BD8B6